MIVDDLALEQVASMRPHVLPLLRQVLSGSAPVVARALQCGDA